VSRIETAFQNIYASKNVLLTQWAKSPKIQLEGMRL